MGSAKKKPVKEKASTNRKSEAVISPARAWFRRTRKSVKLRPKWQRLGIYATIVLVLLTLTHYGLEATSRPVKNPQFGVSFSIKYAKEMNLDWKETYTALLDDMGLRHYRLMSYWDDGEPIRGQYVFDDLDWQMDEAHKRGAKVSLALGLRQPRWPECHRPSWYNSLNREQQDEALFQYLEATVTRYKDHPALLSYQLENEAVNTWFGTCTDKDIDQERLAREFDFVKSLDSNTPVWMSLSDQHGLPLNEPVPDKYGYSVYRTVYNNKTGPFKFYATYPTPVWYHRARAWWITTFKDRDIFIHELQLEPWAPEATVNVSVEEQDKSMDLEQMEINADFARRIGIQEIYTWGGEWWYWRKTVRNDPSVWEKARELLVEQQ